MKIKQKRGISLIVLVITIIVMIILAAAIILSLNSSGIIGKANKAKTDTDTANLKEAASVVYAEYDLAVKTGEVVTQTAEEYVKDNLSKQGFSAKQLESLKVADDGTITIASGYPTIPEGFTVSSIPGETEVSEGLVIYEGTAVVTASDTDNNGIIDAQETRDQYVWIPVDNINEFLRKDGYENGSLQVLVKDNIATEPFSLGTLSETNDSTGEYAEYAAMVESVKKHGGFYIARYEAGDSSATGQRTSLTAPKGIISRKNAYAYNVVPWGQTMDSILPYYQSPIGAIGGAAYLARNRYPESADNQVVSTLCYGIEYDAIINFMKDVKNPDGINSEYYIYDSTNMGWYSNNYSSGNVDHKTGIDVDEKSSNKVKNIYDLAGNLGEWTMEAYDTIGRVCRSGNYSDSGSESPASIRVSNGVQYYSNSLGFRVALYLR